jgi:hypothetical protein
MALGPPFVVQIETKSGSSFGDTMNDLRSWLDHRKIQTPSFLPITQPDGGIGFEIGFNSEDEAPPFRTGVWLNLACPDVSRRDAGFVSRIAAKRCDEEGRDISSPYSQVSTGGRLSAQQCFSVSSSRRRTFPVFR